MATAAQPGIAAPDAKTWFGHPRGLFFLFTTEMWERFSYYGMRSLLVLYMVDHLFLRPDVGKAVLGFTAVKSFIEHLPWVRALGPLDAQPLSSQIYGLYTAFVYLTPFFGGLLADRVLGQRRTVIVGAILMAIGHFLMASEHLFFLALIFLILGNGAFKPNISTQVGLLYPQGDPRRDSAFTIFYMGINLGAFLSPLVCGTLGQKVGWHWGFGAAGVGMVAGLCIYLYGQRYLSADNLTQRRQMHVVEKEKLTRDELLRVI
ncbi:MAG TPA: peptide MFS transporter, partial [Gaiellales bacterium]|nr:peptide MFS transporter [Gaiellales bacterium]